MATRLSAPVDAAAEVAIRALLAEGHKLDDAGGAHDCCGSAGGVGTFRAPAIQLAAALVNNRDAMSSYENSHALV